MSIKLSLREKVSIVASIIIAMFLFMHTCIITNCSKIIAVVIVISGIATGLAIGILTYKRISHDKFAISASILYAIVICAMIIFWYKVDWFQYGTLAITVILFSSHLSNLICRRKKGLE